MVGRKQRAEKVVGWSRPLKNMERGGSVRISPGTCYLSMLTCSSKRPVTHFTRATPNSFTPHPDLPYRFRVDGGNHYGLAVASEAVSQHRGHHGVTVRNVLPVETQD